MTDNAHRATVLVVLVALFLVGAAVDQALGKATTGASPAAVSGQGASAVPPESALSSSWYCQMATEPTPAAGGPPPSGAGLTPSLLLANAGGRALEAQVSPVGARGGRSAHLTVAAHGRAVVSESSLAPGAYAAATVDVYGGGMAVEQQLAGPQGLSVAPCASQVGRHWYFASGSTYGADRLLLSLYNPLPTGAIADVSFATGTGALRPSDDQGIVVGGGQQVVLDVGLHVQQQRLVATDVTVRLGRLVASETQTGAPSSGLAMVLGAPSAGSAWYFPAGLVGPGAHEQVGLYNPSSVAAQVTVGLSLAAGSAEPMSFSVAPGSVTVLDANSQHRIPLGTLFSLVVQAVNGVGVVAERSVTDGPPRHQRGRADLLGGRPARRWVLAGGSPPASAGSVVVENPGPAPVALSVVPLAGAASGPPPGALSGVVVPPGRPLALPLAAHLSRAQLGLPLVVAATGPIVVEQDLAPSSGLGIATVLGEPAG